MAPLPTTLRIPMRLRARCFALLLLVAYHGISPATAEPDCPPEEASILSPDVAATNDDGVPWSVHLCNVESWTLAIVVNVLAGPDAGKTYTLVTGDTYECDPGSGHDTPSGTFTGVPPSNLDGGDGEAFLTAKGCSGAELEDDTSFVLVPGV